MTKQIENWISEEATTTIIGEWINQATMHTHGLVSAPLNTPALRPSGIVDALLSLI